MENLLFCTITWLTILVNELIIKISWFPLWSGGKKKGLSKKNLMSPIFPHPRTQVYMACVLCQWLVAITINGSTNVLRNGTINS